MSPHNGGYCVPWYVLNMLVLAASWAIQFEELQQRDWLFWYRSSPNGPAGCPTCSTNDHESFDNYNICATISILYWISLFHLFESEIIQYYIWLLIYGCNTISLVASLVGILDDDSLKLYTLIWKRTMACQMEASRTEMVGYSCASFIFPCGWFYSSWW